MTQNNEEIYQPAYPDYPSDYVPNLVEIHDEVGILARIEHMQLTLNAERPPNFASQIVMWMFDGSEAQNVAYVHTENTVLVNRISQMQTLDRLSAVLGGES